MSLCDALKRKMPRTLKFSDISSILNSMEFPGYYGKNGTHETRTFISEISIDMNRECARSIIIQYILYWKTVTYLLFWIYNFPKFFNIINIEKSSHSSNTLKASIIFFSANLRAKYSKNKIAIIHSICRHRGQNSLSMLPVGFHYTWQL